LLRFENPKNALRQSALSLSLSLTHTHALSSPVSLSLSLSFGVPQQAKEAKDAHHGITHRRKSGQQSAEHRRDLQIDTRNTGTEAREWHSGEQKMESERSAVNTEKMRKEKKPKKRGEEKERAI